MRSNKNRNVVIIERKTTIMMTALILGVLASISPLATDVYLPSFPEMSESLGASPSQVQLTLTTFLLGMALGQLVIGPYSDVIGRRLPLNVSIFVFVMTTILSAFTNSIWTLILLRFIQGFSGAGGVVLSRAIVRDLFTGYQVTKYMAILTIINSVITVLAPVIGGILLTFKDWRGIFIFLSILSIVMFFSVFFGIKETLLESERSHSGIKNTILNFGQLFKNKVFVGYVFTQGFIYGGFFAYLAGSPFVLQNLYGLSAQSFSISFAVNAAGVIVATLIASKLALRFTEKNVLQITLIISLLSSIILFFTIFLNGALTIILITFFFIFSCLGVVGMLCNSLGMQSQKEYVGSASALLGLVPFIFGSITAPLVGIDGGQTALPMGMIILICNVLAMIIFKRYVR